MQAGDPSPNYMMDGAYPGGMPGAENSFQGGLEAGGAGPVGAGDNGMGAAPPLDHMPSQTDQAAIDQLMAEEREKHEEQLKLETRAREELEDMILRIEKHFKAEQAARKKAEEMLQTSLAAEVESRNKLEEVNNKRQQEQRLVEDERAAIKRERNALESMRQEFEAELQTARLEVSKAQEALASSEERIRTAEQLERSRLEVDYQSKLHAAYAEKERMREELHYRTIMMNEEMEKWRQQALMTSTAVMEAKNEVMERKRELEGTKEKMDKLLEKLYIGRERGIELSGAIASNQRMMSFMPGMLGGQGGGLPPVQGAHPLGPMGMPNGKAMMMSKAPSGGYQPPQPPLPMQPMHSILPMQAWGPIPGAGGHLPGELSPPPGMNGNGGGATKLPPIKKQNSLSPPVGLSIDEQLAYLDSMEGASQGHQQQQQQQSPDGPQKGGGYAQSKIAQNIAEAGNARNAKRNPVPGRAKKPERNQAPARWN
ncbi:hypothetical protein DUNSADRAFT_6014 [Dunaliella salina]|uniref:Uncharacterized protein n=1 Tax=Dunaliella salina TaxID=3046 RepID=A0ABQ7GP46_DUNSA|nr:hypothetical protein DUNSADRAFT_6014 [Dunaliella salina]|eukprot:KAF5836379.1 hypothetical protein DUNSADRAFT_6014 [Dunaliella salina]